MSQDTLPTIKGVHHQAYLCRDAQETREFYEGVLGLKPRCALRIDTRPGTHQPLRYVHLFFEMADGNYIAFFDLPDSVKSGYFRNKDSMQEYHFAMELSSETELEQFKARLEGRGIPVRGPIDHGFVKSIYFHDPNGLQLEFTVRAARHDEILDEEEARLDDVLSTWTAETGPVKEARLRKPDAA